jgi:hypothetical protein
MRMCMPGPIMPGPIIEGPQPRSAGCAVAIAIWPRITTAAAAMNAENFGNMADSPHDNFFSKWHVEGGSVLI